MSAISGPAPLRLLVLVLLACLAHCAHGFGLPGLVPIGHKWNSVVTLEVNAIRSRKNPVQMDFYSKKLPFSTLQKDLPNSKKTFSSNLGLGAILSGERHKWSPYKIEVGLHGCYCMGETKMDPKMIKRVVKLINRRYKVQLLADGLPVVNRQTDVLSGGCTVPFTKYWSNMDIYQPGYYLGVPAGCGLVATPILNNHVDFEFTYYIVTPEEASYFTEQAEKDGRKTMRKRRKPSAGGEQSPTIFLIVGATAVPYSIDWSRAEGLNSSLTCGNCAGGGEGNDAYAADDEGNEPVKSDLSGDLDDGPEGENGDIWEMKEVHDDEEDGKGQAPDGGAAGDGGDSVLYSQTKSTILMLPVKPTDSMTVRWTYAVRWIHNQDIKWASRWDSYFNNPRFKVNHSWYIMTVILSTGILTALLSLVLAVLVRALRRDILKSAPVFLSPEDELIAQEEENGWKAVRGDVFRPPPQASLLALAAAAGAQSVLALSLCVLFGLLGFAAPSSRGNGATLLLVFFLLSSFVGGAVCACLSLALGQPKSWCTVVQFLLGFSGAVMLLYTVVNMVLRVAGSSGAIPVSSMISLYSLWLVIYCPLGLVGAAAGFAVGHKPLEKVTAVQRVIEYEKVWSLFRAPGVLLYSGVPAFFVGVFLLSILFGTMWGDAMNYIFGVMALTGTLWLATCALTSVAVVYYNLCGENHRWHWLGFLAPSSCGFPIAIFVTWYFFAKIRATTLTAVLVYSLYMLLFTYMYVIISGAIGFISSFYFVRFIYGPTKSD